MAALNHSPYIQADTPEEFDIRYDQFEELPLNEQKGEWIFDDE